MKPKEIPILVLFCFAVILASAKTTVAQNYDKEEIIQRVQEYENAYNRGDSKATAAIYAKNGYHTYATGITHHGRTEIEQGLEESFEGQMKGTQIKLVSEDIRFITSEIAYEHESFFLSGVKMPDGTTIPTIKGYCLGIYEKIDGHWYALAMQCMVPLSPPK